MRIWRYGDDVNQGLLLIECPDAVRAYTGAEKVSLDLESGRIRLVEDEFTFPPLPPAILAIRKAGGLLAYKRKRLGG